MRLNFPTNSIAVWPTMFAAVVCATAATAVADRSPFSSSPTSYRPVPAKVGGVDGGCADYKVASEDGSAENSIGLTAGGSMVWANQVEAAVGCELVTAVKVSFGVIPNGTAAQIYILSDPNQDGHPGDSVSLATANVVVANADSDVLNSYPIGPVLISGKFFIAVRVSHNAGQFPSNIDQTAPNGGVSWIAFGMTDNNNPFGSSPPGNVLNMSTLGGLNGDWTVRAAAAAGDPCAVSLPLCAADVGSASNGPPDGSVNVNDLLIVINTWGQTQNPPGTGPRPKGDNHPLPNGNCLVNVNDLLNVINNWGACPIPTGRCCFTDGTCQVLTAGNCSASGGTYQGDGSTCSPNPCVALPTNDECAGATQVFDGATPIDTTGATDSNPDPPGGACIFGGPGNFNKDLWYRYIATCNGFLTVDTCATTGSVTDTVLQVFSGACGALTEVACDDDACTGNPAGDRSKVTFVASQGTEYKIRVGTWGTNPGGPQVLTIACAAINSDICLGATSLTLGAQVCDNLSKSTQDSAPPCGSPSVPVGKGMWFSIIGNGNTLTASLCGSNKQFYDARLSVYCGTSCDQLVCVNAANNDTCGLFEQVSWCSALNQKYWMLVHTDDAAGEGQFCIVVNNGASCNNPLQCVTPGDDCSVPITIGAGNVSYPWSTVGMTSNPANGNTCDQFGDSPTIYADLWLKWTAAETGNVHLSNCGSPFDDKMAMYSNTNCPQSMSNMIGCGDDNCGVQSQFISSVTAGQQYLIRIGSWQSSGPTGTGTLNITHLQPVTNDECASAIAVVTGANNIGNNIGATTSSGIPGGQCAGATAFQNDIWFHFTNTGAASDFTFSLCGTTGDTILSVLTSSAGGVCPPVAELACNDDFCGLQSQVQVTIGANQKVFVRVGGWNGNTFTNGVLNITAAGPPAQQAPDLCANAELITVGSTTVRSNTAATPAGGNDPELPAGSPSCHWNGTPATTHNTVWFKFVATAASHSIQTCNSALPFRDSVIAIYSGNCGSLVELACGDDDCGGSNFYSMATANGLTPGTTYYILVANPGSWEGSIPGTFTLNLN